MYQVLAGQGRYGYRAGMDTGQIWIQDRYGYRAGMDNGSGSRAVTSTRMLRGPGEGKARKNF